MVSVAIFHLHIITSHIIGNRFENPMVEKTKKIRWEII